MCAVVCRVSSPSSSPADHGWPTPSTAPSAAVIGTTVAAAGGGALVVIGVAIAALLAPAFLRYRV